MKFIERSNSKKSMPLIYLARLMLDIRNICNDFEINKVFTTKSLEICEYLIDNDKEHLFHISNFDQDFLDKCRTEAWKTNIKYGCIGFDYTSRLEMEQAIVLKKFNIQIRPLNITKYIKTKRGELNGTSKSFEWE